ncbi:hypothetical protein AB1N83_009123 [Pleurotus pulmonarius]
MQCCGLQLGGSGVVETRAGVCLRMLHRLVSHPSLSHRLHRL